MNRNCGFCDCLITIFDDFITVGGEVFHPQRPSLDAVYCSPRPREFVEEEPIEAPIRVLNHPKRRMS